MQRSKNRETATHTLKILEQGYYFNPEGNRIVIRDEQARAEAGTELWTAERLEKLTKTAFATNFETGFKVYNDTTFNIVRKLAGEYPENALACLNFASAKNPGGGFQNGAQAQEESLARSSGLYNCLLQTPEYYNKHRGMKSCLYTDTMIYSPLVPVFKNEKGETMESPVFVSIVTSAAVNAGVVRKQERSNEDKILPSMRTRIDKLLALFAEKGQEILVLGAWGCGVFQNEPEDIAELFAEAFSNKYKNVFKQVSFAILSKNTDRFILPFEERFGI